MIRAESARSSLPHGPNIIAPRHSELTWTPVRPSGRYCMKLLLCGVGDADDLSRR
jgi:hypothetical protein